MSEARAAFARVVDAEGPAARRAAAEAAFAVGARLGPRGRVACPNALCAALGLRRQTYDDVVRRYATDAPRRRPRPPRAGSAAARMLAALQRAGDVRFVPSTREAA